MYFRTNKSKKQKNNDAWKLKQLEIKTFVVKKLYNIFPNIYRKLKKTIQERNQNPHKFHEMSNKRLMKLWTSNSNERPNEVFVGIFLYTRRGWAEWSSFVKNACQKKRFEKLYVCCSAKHVGETYPYSDAHVSLPPLSIEDDSPLYRSPQSKPKEKIDITQYHKPDVSNCNSKERSNNLVYNSLCFCCAWANVFINVQIKYKLTLVARSIFRIVTKRFN